MGENKIHINRDLLQILMNIVIIGIFLIAKDWLFFYYGSWVLAAIFGVLITLMCCLLAINIYSSITGSQNKKKQENAEDKQFQAVLYKQMKRLEAQILEGRSEAAGRDLEEKLEDMRANQLRSAKAILNKAEQIQNMQEELHRMLEQTDLAEAASLDAVMEEVMNMP